MAPPGRGLRQRHLLLRSGRLPPRRHRADPAQRRLPPGALRPPAGVAGDDGAAYTIGEFSRLSRLTVTTLRHYDRSGPPARRGRPGDGLPVLRRRAAAGRCASASSARRGAPRRPPGARPEPADPGERVGAPTPEGRGRTGRAGATPRPARRAGRDPPDAGRRGGRARPDRRHLARRPAGTRRSDDPSCAARLQVRLRQQDRADTAPRRAVPGRPRGRAHRRGVHRGRHLRRLDVVELPGGAAVRTAHAGSQELLPYAYRALLAAVATRASSPAGRSARSTSTRETAAEHRAVGPRRPAARDVRSASGRCASDRRAGRRTTAASGSMTRKLKDSSRYSRTIASSWDR